MVTEWHVKYTVYKHYCATSVSPLNNYTIFWEFSCGSASVWSCHHSSSGHCCGTGLSLGLRTSTCWKQPKKKKIVLNYTNFWNRRCFFTRYYFLFCIHVFSDYEPPSGQQVKQKFCASHILVKTHFNFFASCWWNIYCKSFSNYQILKYINICRFTLCNQWQYHCRKNMQATFHTFYKIAQLLSPAHISYTSI